MKVGCTSASFDAALRSGQMDLHEFLRIAGDELEMDGVELADVHFASTEPQELRRLKKACVDAHLTIAGLSVNNDFGDRARRDVERYRVQQWCDVAAYIGAPIVRVLAGTLPASEGPRDEGRIVGLVKRIIGPGRVDPRRTWSDIAETLRACADYAGERGITLALQNRRSEGVVSSPAQLAQMVRDVGSPWLRVCLDLADFPDRTGVDGPIQLTVQARARFRDVTEEGAESGLSWPLLLQVLRLGRYRNFVLLDYDGVEAPMTAVPRAARYLRGAIHLLSRQQVLSESVVDRNAGGFTHPDLAPGAVEDALARVRGQTPAR